MSHTKTYNDLVRSLKSSKQTTKQIKVAVLADFASQHLAKAIKAAGLDKGISIDLFEAPYDSIQGTIIDQDSELYTGNYQYILIVQSPWKLYRNFSRHKVSHQFADDSIQQFMMMCGMLRERTAAKILLANYPTWDDSVFGSFACKTESSFLFQLRKLNFGMMQFAVQHPDVHLIDVEQLATVSGMKEAFEPKLYIHADLAFSLDFLAGIAQRAIGIINALEGHFVKCVILDLDNTLWGGIIGDDGLEHIQIGDLGIGKAFSNLQLWLRNLKNRGIILAVCSKNTEAVAKEVFEKHPLMTLRLEDIAVFVANWETKVDNIRFIQTILNIGFDSMVFLDDNPFERGMVKEAIPELIVPELPEDPAEYLPFLQQLNLFETASVSEADAKRTRQYQEEAGRAVLQKTFQSEAEFLESLGMVAEIKPFCSFSAPRVAQLSQRSNQFNLRTVRYTEADILKMIGNAGKVTLSISLTDKFGDYGLISAVIGEVLPGGTLFIDTWIMSCRVLKRGVEQYVLNELVQMAFEKGCSTLVGEFLPTAKNALVQDHYAKLGFMPTGDTNKWLLNIKDFVPFPTHIKNESKYVNH